MCEEHTCPADLPISCFSYWLLICCLKRGNLPELSRTTVPPNHLLTTTIITTPVTLHKDTPPQPQCHATYVPSWIPWQVPRNGQIPVSR